MAQISSAVAARTASMAPKCSASRAAALSPMLRMPRPNSSLSRLFCLERAMAASRLSALLSLNLSRVSSCSLVRVYRSAAERTSPRSTSWVQTATPSPSMSMALREAKWIRLRSDWAGHSGLTQRRAASSARWATGAPQEGQTAGIR